MSVSSVVNGPVVNGIAGEDFTFPPKVGATADLILRHLMRNDTITADGRSHLANKVRKTINLNDTPTIRGLVSEALRLMAMNGIIELTDRHLKLKVEISPDAAATLVTTDHETHKMLNVPQDVSADEELIKSVKLVYGIIQRAAERARTDKSRVNAEGHVAINVSGALLAEGIPDVIGEPARYYLSKIGHAVSCMKCDGPLLLWWWAVATVELDTDALLQLAGSDKSYESRRSSTPRARAPQPVRTFAPTDEGSAAVPTVLTGLVGPFGELGASQPVRTPLPSDVARRVNLSRESRSTVLIKEPCASTATSNQLAAVVTVAKRLEQEVAELRKQLNQREVDHTGEVDKLKTEHAAELERLTEHLTELTTQLAQHSTTSVEAAELIARYAAEE